MKASELDLYRPYYKRGDLVWIISPKGKLFEGVVLNGYEGTYGKRSSKPPFTLYSVFTLHGSEFQGRDSDGLVKRPNAAYVRLKNLVPRYKWEERPLQRLEEQPQKEVTLERLRQQIEDFIRTRT